jgi:hypothetical protein
MTLPIAIKASVAVKLPGAMQLRQVPIITGASFTIKNLPVNITA